MQTKSVYFFPVLSPEKFLLPGERLFTLPVFPRLGAGSFTTPPHKVLYPRILCPRPKSKKSKNLFVRINQAQAVRLKEPRDLAPVPRAFCTSEETLTSALFADRRGGRRFQIPLHTRHLHSAPPPLSDPDGQHPEAPRRKGHDARPDLQGRDDARDTCQAEG